MRPTIVIAALASAAAAAAASPQPRLQSPALPGFVIGYEAANDEQAIREEVPRGETVERWARMVTTQRFAEVAARVTPAQYLGIVVQGLATSCPKARIGPIAAHSVSGKAAASIRVDCPLLAATGLPETFFMLAIPVGRDMHVKQAAFRRVPTAADVAWAQSILAGTTVCTAPSPGC